MGLLSQQEAHVYEARALRHYQSLEKNVTCAEAKHISQSAQRDSSRNNTDSGIHIEGERDRERQRENKTIFQKINGSLSYKCAQRALLQRS